MHPPVLLLLLLNVSVPLPIFLKATVFAPPPPKGEISLITPANATTNAQGYVIVDVIYPQDAAYWLEVILEARAAVQGTEFSRSSTFLLPGLATDFNSATTAPPGPRSPFGVNDCTTNN